MFNWPTPFLAEKLAKIKPYPIKYKLIAGKKQRSERHFKRKLIERIVHDGESWWRPIIGCMDKERSLAPLGNWPFITGYVSPGKLPDPEEVLWFFIWDSFVTADLHTREDMSQKVHNTDKALKYLLKAENSCPEIAEDLGLDQMAAQVKLQLLNDQIDATLCQSGENQFRDAFIRLMASELRPQRGWWKFASLSRVAELATTCLGESVNKECIKNILHRFQYSKKHIKAISDYLSLLSPKTP